MPFLWYCLIAKPNNPERNILFIYDYTMCKETKTYIYKISQTSSYVMD